MPGFQHFNEKVVGEYITHYITVHMESLSFKKSMFRRKFLMAKKYAFCSTSKNH